MNDPLQALDPVLAARFGDAHRHIPDDPFVGATLERIAAERARARMMRRILQGLVLVVVIVASPWLIAGSLLLSNLVDRVFAEASQWLATPPGMAAGALVGVALVLLYRAYANRHGW